MMKHHIIAWHGQLISKDHIKIEPKINHMLLKGMWICWTKEIM